MQRTILTALVATLVTASTAQIALASEHHHRHSRVTHAPVAEQFRNANNAVPAPARPGSYSDYWSNFSEGHINMVGH
jgi:hypothetical protein